jgi:hypothetical protein
LVLAELEAVQLELLSIQTEAIQYFLALHHLVVVLAVTQ